MKVPFFPGVTIYTNGTTIILVGWTFFTLWQPWLHTLSYIRLALNGDAISEEN